MSVFDPAFDELSRIADVVAGLIRPRTRPRFLFDKSKFVEFYAIQSRGRGRERGRLEKVKT